VEVRKSKDFAARGRGNPCDTPLDARSRGA
jgi:hypothetical protein